MVSLNIAIAGDLHGQWDRHDALVLESAAADALLVVGDLSDGDCRYARELADLTLPVACVLGNHDTGWDRSGGRLERQIALLGERHCAWRSRGWSEPALAVVGARAGSAGGGFRVSPAVEAVYGPMSCQSSADRIIAAALEAPLDQPLVLLAHCGPSGLGSEAADPCGRDWQRPARDWGDQDLSIAIHTIRRQRPVDLVVFGHMHHRLRRGGGTRRSLHVDRSGTAYINAACVPRHQRDPAGNSLHHFSWARFESGALSELSHRWYDRSGRLLYRESLLNRPPDAPRARTTASPATGSRHL
ncbi:TIGR04168 family protein [Synechococcus sp. RSCCF101]|nr:TIGR04168 family protein [Synechococcus sp. RSCCF101]QEY33375.1 TIGR04168 family protein [Synechococcus sp. RSCCF101]